MVSVRGEVQELVNWQATPRWELLQELLARGNHPLESELASPSTFSFAASVGGRRQWTRDSLELRFRPTYLLGLPPDSSAEVHSLVVEPSTTWRHELTAHWSSEATAGMEVAFRLGDSGQPVWQPAGRGTLGFARDEGQASLTAAHRMEASTFLGRLMMVEEARLDGSLPLGRGRRFVVAASTGYQFGRGLDFDQDAADDSSHALVGDASFTWRVRASLLLSARYQVVWQRSSFDAPEPLDYLRHLGLLSVAFVYPETGALLARTSRGLRLVRTESEGKDSGSASGS